MSEFIPLCIPSMTGKEKILTAECFDTNWVSYVGSFVGKFEEQIAVKSGAAHAIAVTSGTAGLHLGLRLAGVVAGDEVVMPGISFVAPANAVRYMGAWPVFLDIEESDWQISAPIIRRFLETCNRSSDGKLINPETKRPVTCIMPVHLLGGLCDTKEIGKICEEFGLPLVEDAAESLGAKFNDRALAAPIGTMDESRRFLVTSFNGNKIITTGGGGAVLTNDAEQVERVKHLSTTAKSDPVYFVHDELGYNYRMTNVAAAMGVAQIESLESRVQKKRQIAATYSSRLSQIKGCVVHPDTADYESSFWLYTLSLNQECRPVIDALEELKIQARPLWHPLPDLEYLSKDCWNDGLAFGRDLVSRAISLPCSHDLTADQQERVIASIEQIAM